MAASTHTPHTIKPNLIFRLWPIRNLALPKHHPNAISFKMLKQKHKLIRTFRNRFDSIIFRYVQNMNPSKVLSMNNIVSNVHDRMYQQLSLYTDRISVESIGRTVLPLVLMPFYHCHMS